MAQRDVVEKTVTDSKARQRNCQETVVDVLVAIGKDAKTARNLEALGDAYGFEKQTLIPKHNGVVKPAEWTGLTPSTVVSGDGVFLVGWADSIHSGTIVKEGSVFYYGDQVDGFRRVAGDTAGFDAWFLGEVARWWAWYERAKGVKPKAQTFVFAVL
eukprot:TRINITY_DN7413_c0_g1_i1.p1 TRINITY_DN7413_c0_g1~~TRINITY_DN7413_c0_g1_i1.p1  ORF type:complete len:168 (+),score=25.49 TRINITY_DN7413_c0_g1_i1:36-506(+)